MLQTDHNIDICKNKKCETEAVEVLKELEEMSEEEEKSEKEEEERMPEKEKTQKRKQRSEVGKKNGSVGEVKRVKAGPDLASGMGALVAERERQHASTDWGKVRWEALDRNFPGD